MTNSMTTDQTANRGIELLNALITLKSKEDGVPRTAIGVLGPKEGYDQFAKDVQEVANLIFAAQQAVPLMVRLADFGRALEVDGKLMVDHGESYAVKALNYLTQATADLPRGA